MKHWGSPREKTTNPDQKYKPGQKRDKTTKRGHAQNLQEKRKGACATGGGGKSQHLQTIARSRRAENRKGRTQRRNARQAMRDRRTRNSGAAGKLEGANPNICRRTRGTAEPKSRMGSKTQRLNTRQKTPQRSPAMGRRRARQRTEGEDDQAHIRSQEAGGKGWHRKAESSKTKSPPARSLNNQDRPTHHFQTQRGRKKWCARKFIFQFFSTQSRKCTSTPDTHRENKKTENGN